MKTSILVYLLSAGLLFCTRLSATAAELPVVVPDALGVCIHFTDPRPGEMEMLAGAGFRWIRTDLAWSATEREKGRYDFSAYDRLLATLSAHKIRALLIFDYANPHYDGGLSPATDEGRQAFARWAVAAVHHFRNRGVLWEMYNEPNIGFWKPKPDVQQYIKLALAVGKALRQAQPGELYIGPGTSEIALPFIEECLKAGLLEYWCGVSVHPYRQSHPETVAFDYVRLRAVIDRYAPKGKTISIISSEWGYPCAWRGVDPAQQGKLLARKFLINLANGVPVSIWYDWHDDGTNAKDQEHTGGTVRFPYFPGRTPPYDPKPAYFAAQTLARVLAGCHFQRRLPVGTPHDYVLAFAKDTDDVRLVAWTAGSSHTIVIPTPGGRYTATAHSGQSLPLRVADAKGLPVVLSDAPTYLVPERPGR